MKNGVRVAVAAVLLVFCACSSSFGAEFRLKNGDAVSGELMSYDGTTFRVKSSFGVLSIEASDMAVIGLNTEEGVVDIVLGAPTASDRDRVRGAIEYVREGEVKIKTDYGYVVVNPLDKATGIFLSEAEAGPVKPGAALQPVKGQQSIEAKGFTFALQGCSRKGESVECHLLLTSNEQDKELGIYADSSSGSSYILDDFGNAYYAKRAILGNRSDQGYVNNTLFGDVPMKAMLYFEGVPSQAKMIAMLIIECRYDNKHFVVKFANISFSQ